MKKLLLCGYMGSGKTTVGRILAQKTGLRFTDLDQHVEHKTGMSVSEIFSTKGELFFRKTEHRMLFEILDSSDSFVLALGGGTPAYANNHTVLNRGDVVSIYLKASIATLTSRLLSERASRPLLADASDAQLSESIAKHLFERNFYYAHATHTIIADGKTADEIATEILLKLA